MKRSLICSLAVFTIALAAAQGSGMLIPKDKSIPPLAIKHQRVAIEIKNGVATAKLEQVFKNSTNRDLEAVYVFPLPENATIADFAMYINGKRMSGELVEKGKARKIYEDIVRRMKDPGLLEYLGGNLFRVSVYPVVKNGEQRIELEYSQTLDFDGGLYKYVYPLKTGEKSSQTLEDFTVSARIHSSVPLKSIYSPSHEVGITRKSDHEAVIGFEEDRSLLDKDFVLYYGVSKKDFGLNLITHAVKKDDGYFMMMLAPSVTPPGGKAMAKDVTLVLDTSGSMAGTKIEQARKALEYCVNRLNDGDRFNIVRFSTDVETLSKDLADVTKENRKKALAFVDDIVARGGTAIDEALSTALAMNYDEKRPSIVLFLTDGKPTVGESDPEIIVKNVAGANKGKARVFVFGVGDKVNTHLLDRVSGEHGGLSKYVKTDEDIEVKVSSLADKMSHPVLSRVSLEIDKLTTRKVHPREMPDLFSGDQLTIFGRYADHGHVAIRLLGEVNGKKREFVYEGDFPAENADNIFIPRLWATRRVGHLLDQIRLHGEDKELKDEVIRLSREYGIMTPYTSYLVLENEKAYVDHGIERQVQAELKEADASRVFARKSVSVARPAARREAASTAPGRPQAAPAPRPPEPAMVPVFEGAADEAVAADALAYNLGVGGGARGAGDFRGRARVLRQEAEQRDGYLRRDSGEAAVELSEAIARYKKADKDQESIETVRHVGKKIFYRIGGQWVDSDYKKEMKTRKIPFAGDEYFKLLKDKPELKPFLALGEKVIVVLDDGTALIVE